MLHKSDLTGAQVIPQKMMSIGHKQKQQLKKIAEIPYLSAMLAKTVFAMRSIGVIA